MLKTTTAGILAAVVIGGLAHAETSKPEYTTPASASSMSQSFWAGGYLGVQLGYSYGDFEFSLDTFDSDSAIGGVTAGYLWNVAPGWYLGPELQYDRTDITVTDSSTGNTASFKEIGRLKLIVGYELGDGLLYGSAGVAYGNVEGFGVSNVLDGSGGSYSVGLGYDWIVADHWTVGAEYQNSRFNDIGDQGGDVALNTLQLKAGYRF